MIKDINYSVTFPTNGISLSGNLSFAPGITAIIGDNGSGKTFGSIEMIRYLLFGKKALRGSASDYKQLVASATVTIKGQEYRIERTAKGEKITDASEETLAVGAEAVTQKCIELLGYGLDVFDVINASVQKESDKLSKMQPTARKRLIDQVVGLSSSEGVEKMCREEAKGLKREAEALEDHLVILEPPVKPDGYRKSSEIKADLDVVKAQEELRRTLELRIAGRRPQPEEVPAPTADIEALIEHEANRVKTQLLVADAERNLQRIPEAQYTDEQLNAAEAYLKYREELARRGPEPIMTKLQAELIIDEWHHRAALIKIGDTEVHCPSCGHDFVPGQELGPEPEISVAEAQAQIRANDLWAETLVIVDEPELLLSKKEIESGRIAIGLADRRAELLAITWLPVPEDKNNELREAQMAQARYEAYRRDLALWADSDVDANLAETELAALPPLTASVVDLDKAYVEARIYETKVADFERSEQRQAVIKEDIAEKLRRSAEYKKGAEALIKIRAAVKAYLAPALSRVSSALISQMSGGVLNNMIVDEDMNVTVDGQDISTLSGAGSTVANLALRLALGQVLARDTFPVFIADEADADLSSSRAQFTAECLGNLRDKLKQILVITHKEVTVADSVITR